MIKGLMITPPVIGRIAIGKVVERNGKRLPEKDDEFTITTQVQARGQWILHPLDETLRQTANQPSSGIKEGSKPSLSEGSEEGDSGLQPASAQPSQRSGKRSLKEKMGVVADAQQAPDSQAQPAATTSNATATTPARRKLRSIPVRVLFNDPDLNLRAHYTLFDRSTARPVCVGDGESCKRVTSQGLAAMPCPGPDACAFGQDGCKPYGRLNLVIGDSDELGSFVFRTTGFNSIRTLTARLQYFAAVSSGHLAGMPLELKLRGKSTTQSHRSAIYYADLVVRSGLTLNEAIVQAKEVSAQRQAAGFDQQALDEAARLGYANGSFEDSPEEVADIVEEFYPESPLPEGVAEPVADAETLRRTSPPAPFTSSQTKPQGMHRQGANGTHRPYA
ncbi:phage capsid protein [Comamonas testosteroni TK102]|uniref:Phage capsid protein n=1 Tax=Comamonas testosteroni TK102 TaxID=1392005 RepID=A0A076PMM8_COMTE|nr:MULTISPECIES: phage capsid protein [Comamonas]AIJ45921.1 phage capsid protein [Comamonas testosteroni TK102]